MKWSDLPGFSSGGLLMAIESVIFNNKRAKIYFFREGAGIFSKKAD
jgi:hypothetical protein